MHNLHCIRLMMSSAVAEFYLRIKFPVASFPKWKNRGCCPLKMPATETGETLGRRTFRTRPKSPKNPQQPNQQTLESFLTTGDLRAKNNVWCHRMSKPLSTIPNFNKATIVSSTSMPLKLNTTTPVVSFYIFQVYWKWNHWSCSIQFFRNWLSHLGICN